MGVLLTTYILVTCSWHTLPSTCTAMKLSGWYYCSVFVLLSAVGADAINSMFTIVHIIIFRRVSCCLLFSSNWNYYRSYLYSSCLRPNSHYLYMRLLLFFNLQISQDEPEAIKYFYHPTIATRVRPTAIRIAATIKC